MHVLGFGPRSRATFSKLLMLWGVGDGTWAHLIPHLSTSGLRGKTFEQIVAYPTFFMFYCFPSLWRYANLFLSHLLEPPNVEPTYKGNLSLGLKFDLVDGVPKE